jgi:hypothetical protein
VLSQTWNVHVAGSTRRPFKYCATFDWEKSGTHLAPPLLAYLYADGDLAAFLEDCGAKLNEIEVLLDNLTVAPDADIMVAPAGDLLDVFQARQG